MFSLLKGFGISSSLIIAIGPQNAFVIRQGIRGQHLLLTALICSMIDAILISLGVMGFGHYVIEHPRYIDITKYFAVAFLLIYGLLAFKSIFKETSREHFGNEPTLTSIKKTVLSLLALSLLNPHVYLDTVVLLGSIASQQPSHEQVYFALGAVGASFIWFFSITFGARFFKPLFQGKNSWKFIDAIVAIIMWLMAFTILKF